MKYQFGEIRKHRSFSAWT